MGIQLPVLPSRCLLLLLGSLIWVANGAAQITHPERGAVEMDTVYNQKLEEHLRDKAAMGMVWSYLSAAGFLSQTNEADTVSFAKMKAFMALFASNAEVFDDIHIPTQHGMTALDYAATVFNYLPNTGLQFTYSATPYLERKSGTWSVVGKNPDERGKPKAYIYELLVVKRLFNGLDAKNRPISEERDVPLMFQIEVDAATNKALITNIFQHQ